jgi:hypothetical protein
MPWPNPRANGAMGAVSGGRKPLIPLVFLIALSPLLSSGYQPPFLRPRGASCALAVTASQFLSALAILHGSVSATLRTVALCETLTPGFEAA